MTGAAHAFRAFGWFLWQCSGVGGLGAGLFWIPAICLLLLMTASYKQSPSAARKRFRWLAVLPLTWTAVGFWGACFWRDRGIAHLPRNPDWVFWPVRYGQWIFLATAALLIFRMRQGRMFAALFAFANLYFIAGMTLMAGMAVSGNWP